MKLEKIKEIILKYIDKNDFILNVNNHLFTQYDNNDNNDLVSISDYFSYNYTRKEYIGEKLHDASSGKFNNVSITILKKKGDNKCISIHKRYESVLSNEHVELNNKSFLYKFLYTKYCTIKEYDNVPVYSIVCNNGSVIVLEEKITEDFFNDVYEKLKKSKPYDINNFINEFLEN